MNQQPNEQRNGNKSIWIVWGIITIASALLFGYSYRSAWTSEAEGTAVVSSVLMIFLIPIWLLISFIMFKVTKQKIATWIFGLLLLGYVGYAAYLIITD